MSILCKLGFHKPSKTEYVRVRIVKKRPLKKVHVYHKNYQVCERCGKRLRFASVVVRDYIRSLSRR